MKHLDKKSIKALLLDVDGTLLTSDGRGMQSSTIEALAACRERGVRLFLATGRQPNELTNCLGGFEFDAQVLLNGQLCVDRSGVFFDNPVPHWEVSAMVKQVSEKGYACQFVTRDGSFVNIVNENVLRVCVDLAIDVPPVEDISRAPDMRIYQFNPYVPADMDHLPMSVLKNCVLKRWHPLFSDIYPANGGKMRGIAALMEKTGIDISQCVAFGDSANDVDMLKAAGFSVAMGNANSECRDAADYVTASNDDDGIAKALYGLGMI